VIGVQSDLLFSVSEQEAIAGMLTSAGVSTRFLPLPCIEGHDAFLVDLKTFGHHIGAFLQNRDHHVVP
jgi:homoserine acetyltransferase